MNKPNNWSVFEKLAAPDTTAGERIRLLKRVESSPGLLAQWKAFRVLHKWPELERSNLRCISTESVLAKVRADESLDNGIKRNFPWVAAAALAASIILVFINIGEKENASDITLDDVFGLPTPTIENSLLANL